MHWSFEADQPAAAAKVRKEMVAHLARRVPPDVDLTDAEIIIGELLANAVQHGAGRIQATLRSDNADAFVTVCDEGPGFRMTRPSSIRCENTLLAESGRGMYIIAMLGHDAKTHPLGGNMAVTVQLKTL